MCFVHCLDAKNVGLLLLKIESIIFLPKYTMAHLSVIEEQIANLKLAKAVDKIFTKVLENGIVEYFGMEYIHRKMMNDIRRDTLTHLSPSLSKEDKEELEKLTKTMTLAWGIRIDDKDYTYDSTVYIADFEGLVPE